jgi:hypothetical protein
MIHVTAARALRTLLIAAVVSLPVIAQAADPRNLEECVQMTRAPLEAQCRSIFAAAGQAVERAACLEQIGPQLQSVCEQFFGEGRDFCATCTASCTGTFDSGDGRRRECLAMCLQQPGCS